MINKIIKPCSRLSTVRGLPQHHAHRKNTQKTHATLTFYLWPWNSRVLEVVEVHVRAKVHQTKCSGSWIISSPLDFGQLKTLIVNIVYW